MSKRRWGPIGSILIGAASGNAKSRASTGALLYLAPWSMWLLMLPLALSLRWMASAGTASAVVIGTAVGVGGAALVIHTLMAFRDRGDQRIQVHAGVTTGVAVVWLEVAVMFGLFHRPDVDVWPEFWRLPEFALRAFTVQVWGLWLVTMIIMCISWNINRVARPTAEDKADGQGAESELAKILDGARLAADAEVGANGLIKGSIQGIPGKHVPSDLIGMAGRLESAHSLRPGAIRITPDYADSTRVTYTASLIDPHLNPTPWPGPKYPGTGIEDHPVPLGPYPDGEIAEDWLPGDEEASRPLMHKKIGGVNGSGKSAGWRPTVVEALCRTNVEFFAADVSGKVWQTFGELIRYAQRIVGTNGVDDAGVAANRRDVMDLLAWVERDAMGRQDKWGKAGINQWGPECVTRWGDKFRILVLEEGHEILDPDLVRGGAEVIERILRKVRSAGWLIILVTQRFDWASVPTTCRAQMPGTYCFGQDSARDAAMLLPEDIHEQIMSNADQPGAWGNSVPGKAMVIYAGQPRERRAQPIRFYRATNEQLGAALAKYASPVRTDAEIEALKSGVPSAARTRTDVQDGAGEYGVPEEPDEMKDLYADPDQPVRLNNPADNRPLAQDPNVDRMMQPLPSVEFRKVIEYHLRTILVQGKTMTSPADLAAMKPNTGHSNQNIRNELQRRTDRAEPWEVRVVDPMAQGGSGRAGCYLVLAPLSVEMNEPVGADN
jgi:hypothetical protein